LSLSHSFSAVDLQALAVTEAASVAQACASIPNDDPYSFASVLLAGLQSGEYKAAAIVRDGKAVGFTVWALESVGGWPELVSIATTTAAEHTPPLRKEIDAALCRLAAAEGCKSMRMHTCRPGLVRAALGNGWHTAEIVLRKYL
jgi:hypothetical protein